MKEKKLIIGVLRAIGLLMFLSILTNCNQFASFDGSGEETHLSVNPVFEDPYDRSDSFDYTEATDDGATDGGPTVGDDDDDDDDNGGTPPVVGDDDDDDDDSTPPVVGDDDDDDDDSTPPVVGDDDDDDDDDTPVVIPPREPVDPCVASPWLPSCRKTRDRGGDGGGDGGGDPLMIDAYGRTYESADALRKLRRSKDSYFHSGELNLTSQENGTQFALLGQQDEIQVGDNQFVHIDTSKFKTPFRYQISWVQPHQMRYRFLALPDKDGNVLGIDQLFGDNTFGPDSASPFAADGFEALAKYDRGDALDSSANFSDLYIDKDDAVFDKLRLWHDLNGDGDANTPEERANELVSLSDMGIVYIQLVVNKSFYEIDQHRNEIKYKSIVGFEKHDGEFRLGTAFDLWFRYNPREVLSTGKAKIVNK